MSLELLSAHRCFGGEQRFYRHQSREIGLPMRFAVFLPPTALGEPAPAGGSQPQRVAALLYLAGLTCNEETATIKAGAQRRAAELGLALVMPDTSPRGAGIAGEAEAWDFGVGAGFYLNASQPPWAGHWRMESYIVEELCALLAAQLPIDIKRLGVFGHSMGGHGALTLALRHPGLFQSLSAFAPIASASQCPWGEKAFGGYLGPDRQRWALHDACALMRMQAQRQLGKPPPFPQGILIDQGLDDPFLAEQLHPHLFEAACAQAGQPLTLRRHAGYDHGYYFISTFMDDHLQHHARILNRA
jgi:S-formylglutathione hydrolase